MGEDLVYGKGSVICIGEAYETEASQAAGINSEKKVGNARALSLVTK